MLHVGVAGETHDRVKLLRTLVRLGRPLGSDRLRLDVYCLPICNRTASDGLRCHWCRVLSVVEGVVVVVVVVVVMVVVAVVAAVVATWRWWRSCCNIPRPAYLRA